MGEASEGVAVEGVALGHGQVALQGQDGLIETVVHEAQPSHPLEIILYIFAPVFAHGECESLNVLVDAVLVLLVPGPHRQQLLLKAGHLIALPLCSPVGPLVRHGLEGDGWQLFE